MLAEYFPILLFIVVGLAVGVAPMVLGKLLAPSRPDPEKLSPYECGFEAFEDARMKFDVRYYLIAIQFIVFDLEIIFIVPWTLVFQELGPRALVTMGLFVGQPRLSLQSETLARPKLTALAYTGSIPLVAGRPGAGTSAALVPPGGIPSGPGPAAPPPRVGGRVTMDDLSGLLPAQR